MRILSYFKQKFYEERKRKSGLSFPLFCKIYGVTKLDRQGAIVQSGEGDELQIVHIPLEAYPYNIYVYSVDLHRILGHLDETLSQKLIYAFGKGLCIDAEIANITGGPPEYENYGCNIRISETRSMMTPYLDDLPHLYGQG